YDLLKLFVGAHGSLGVIIEASFKLLPCPDMEIILASRCAGWAEFRARLDDVLRSALTPVVLDLHNLSGDRAQADLVIALAGSAEDVNWQRDLAATLGFAVAPEGLAYDRQFWIQESGPPVHRLSVLPSRLAATLASLGDVSFVARAGCGTVYYRGGPAPGRPDLPQPLLQRVKDAYDPHHILPAPPW
ncbi:MAG TPA: hypothetical protein VNO52_04355, partial [Methylomirabilota bacterium]|nr:hypothetical protein [Methylomirabilota bacterium]